MLTPAGVFLGLYQLWWFLHLLLLLLTYPRGPSRWTGCVNFCIRRGRRCFDRVAYASHRCYWLLDVFLLQDPVVCLIAVTLPLSHMFLCLVFPRLRDCSCWRAVANCRYFDFVVVPCSCQIYVGLCCLPPNRPYLVALLRVVRGVGKFESLSPVF